MKVKKKPVVIDAMEWTGENFNDLHAFTVGKVQAPELSGVEALVVVTNEGNMQAKIGDMILKADSKSIGVHVWPVDRGYFEENYDTLSDQLVEHE